MLDAEGKPAWDRLTPRQRFKYKRMRRWWYPWFYFLYAYVARLGFLDGSAGFHYAFFKAWYFSSVRLLMIEQRTQALPQPGHKTQTKE